jgi:hypothetical protein
MGTYLPASRRPGTTYVRSSDTSCDQRGRFTGPPLAMKLLRLCVAVGPLVPADVTERAYDARYLPCHLAEDEKRPASRLTGRPLGLVLLGRAARIRTGDLLNPIQARYQAAPQPVA